MLLKEQTKLKLSYSAIICGVFAAVIAAVCFLNIENAKLKSARFYASVVEEYVSEESEPEPSVPDWYGKAEINLTELQEENPDVIGWILFENEKISYPVLYSGDNDAYLRHTYKKEYAIAGSIFVDGRNHPDFSDKKTLVYGHNLEDDDTMFGRLPRFLDEEYLKDHRYFQIITSSAAYRYEILSTKIVTPTDDVYQYSEKDTEKSELPEIILSTCYNNRKNRLILTSIRVDEYEF